MKLKRFILSLTLSLMFLISSAAGIMAAIEDETLLGPVVTVPDIADLSISIFEVSETFTVSTNFTLVRMRVKLWRTEGSGDDPFYINLKETNNGNPVTANLTYNAFDYLDLSPTLPASWLEVIPDRAVTINATTEYAINVNYPDGLNPGAYIHWRGQGTSDLGNQNMYSDDGWRTSTNVSSDWDTTLQLYGYTTGIPVKHSDSNGGEYLPGDNTSTEDDRFEVATYDEVLDETCVYFWDEDTQAWYKVWCVPGDTVGTDSGTPAAPTLAPVENTIERFQALMVLFGLNNKMGYFAAIVILMALAYYFFRKEKTLRVVGPLLIFAGAMFAGWIPAWIVVLFAIIFGVIIWGKLRPATA